MEGNFATKSITVKEFGVSAIAYQKLYLRLRKVRKFLLDVNERYEAVEEVMLSVGLLSRLSSSPFKSFSTLISNDKINKIRDSDIKIFSSSESTCPLLMDSKKLV